MSVYSHLYKYHRIVRDEIILYLSIRILKTQLCVCVCVCPELIGIPYALDI